MPSPCWGPSLCQERYYRLVLERETESGSCRWSGWSVRETMLEICRVWGAMAMGRCACVVRGCEGWMVRASGADGARVWHSRGSLEAPAAQFRSQGELQAAGPLFQGVCSLPVRCEWPVENTGIGWVPLHSSVHRPCYARWQRHWGCIHVQVPHSSSGLAAASGLFAPCFSVVMTSKL